MQISSFMWGRATALHASKYRAKVTTSIRNVILLNSKQYFHLKAHNLFEIKVNSYLLHSSN